MPKCVLRSAGRAPVDAVGERIDSRERPRTGGVSRGRSSREKEAASRGSSHHLEPCILDLDRSPWRAPRRSGDQRDTETRAVPRETRWANRDQRHGENHVPATPPPWRRERAAIMISSAAPARPASPQESELASHSMAIPENMAVNSTSCRSRPRHELEILPRRRVEIRPDRTRARPVHDGEPRSDDLDARSEYFFTRAAKM